MKLVRRPKRPYWIPFSRFTKKNLAYPQWRNFIDFAYWNVPLHEDSD